MKKLLVALTFIIVLVLAVVYRPPISTEKLKKEYTTEDSNFVPIAGMDVHYFKKGSGTPLLLIHGTSSSSHTWKKWEDVLSDHFTTYSPDLPGAGLTGPHPESDYSLDAYVEFLEQFTSALGIDSFYLAGNSLGGNIAWKYASRHDNVIKLILVDPSGFYPANRELPTVFKLGRIKLLGKLIEGLNVAPFVSSSLKEVFYNDDLIEPDLVKRYKKLLRRPGNRKAFFDKAASLVLSEESELHNIKCPTLIQWGKEDQWLTADLAPIYMDNIQDNRLIIYEECGHVPQEEMPEKSAADALDFLLERSGETVFRLEGQWMIPGKEGEARVMIEEWSSAGNSELTGRSYVLDRNTGNMDVRENLRLVKTDSTWTYIADPAGQELTEFKLTKTTPDLLVFSNPAHDFPQFISYSWPAADTLHVEIGDTARSMKWTMNKYVSPH